MRRVILFRRRRIVHARIVCAHLLKVYRPDIHSVFPGICHCILAIDRERKRLISLLYHLLHCLFRHEIGRKSKCHRVCPRFALFRKCDLERCEFAHLRVQTIAHFLTVCRHALRSEHDVLQTRLHVLVIDAFCRKQRFIRHHVRGVDFPCFCRLIQGERGNIHGIFFQFTADAEAHERPGSTRFPNDVIGLDQLFQIVFYLDPLIGRISPFGGHKRFHIFTEITVVRIDIGKTGFIQICIVAVTVLRIDRRKIQLADKSLIVFAIFLQDIEYKLCIALRRKILQDRLIDLRILENAQRHITACIVRCRRFEHILRRLGNAFLIRDLRIFALFGLERFPAVIRVIVIPEICADIVAFRKKVFRIKRTDVHCFFHRDVGNIQDTARRRRVMEQRIRGIPAKQYIVIFCKQRRIVLYTYPGICRSGDRRRKSGIYLIVPVVDRRSFKFVQIQVRYGACKACIRTVIDPESEPGIA